MRPGQHLRREQLAEGLAGRHDRDRPVVETVGEDDEPQRHRLVGHRGDAMQAEQSDIVDERAVAGRVQLAEVGAQFGEAVLTGTGGHRGTPTHLVVAAGRGRLGQAAVAKVLAGDPQDVEPRRQPLDLAQEVIRAEAAGTEVLRLGVAGRGQVHARLGEPGQQRGDEHRVPGVVQLELVDRQQP